MQNTPFDKSLVAADLTFMDDGIGLSLIYESPAGKESVQIRLDDDQAGDIGYRIYEASMVGRDHRITTASKELWMHDDATTIARNAKCDGKYEHPVRLQPGAELHAGSSLGAFGFINQGSVIYGNVEIGKYFSCGRGCEVGVVAHPIDALSTHGFTVNSAWFPKVPTYGELPPGASPRVSLAKKTTIGNDVWIGAQCVISAGVTIGDGAIIGANSTVTKDVAPYEIVAGAPAKHIRYRFDEAIRTKLLNLSWWDLPFEKISKLHVRDIEKAIAQLEEIRRKP